MLVPDHGDHRMVELNHKGVNKNDDSNTQQRNGAGSTPGIRPGEDGTGSGSTTTPARPTRPSRDQTFMDVARIFARRSTCLRKSVGACLVRDNHILGSGYNGAPRMEDSCDRVQCLLESNHCVRTVHAEVNAVLSAAYSGVSTRDSTLYTTAKPCFRCEAFLINAGVRTVIYDEEYDDGLNNRIEAAANVHLRRFKDDGSK